MTDLAELKSKARAYFAAIDGAPLDGLTDAATAHLAPDVHWQGFAPLGDLHGPEALATEMLAPLRRAFPSLTRQTHILIAGASDGRKDGGADGAYWVGATGCLVGRQEADVWGIPARRQTLRLRWGEFLRFEDGQITQIQMLIDVIDWLEQIGLSPLPPSRGAPLVYPAPTGVIGDWPEARPNPDLLAYGRRFIFGGLNAYDQAGLGSMGMADYFHPNVKWYGPGGIGACLSFSEFEDLHQRPWLVAFPDRQVQDLDNLIAEGPFLGASSLPGVTATHTGPYLGHGASQRPLAVNGIDFWLEQDGQFIENWVFVDMPHLFAQMGIDLLARVAHEARP